MTTAMRFRRAVTVLGIGVLGCLGLVTPSASAPAGDDGGLRDLIIEMGTPFQDNMILQRGMEVPVWGWSKAGDVVTIQFAGQTRKATADENGRWMLKLDPLEASVEPRTMTVTSAIGHRQSSIGNVLVGEVWMASGQSNMQWMASQCIVGRRLIPEIQARVKAGEEKMPVIREGKVTDVFSSLYPNERAKAQWSENWQGFSAISFAFAYEIARELQVPVGIVNCAFSTTSIQAWIPREGFADGEDAYTQAIYQRIIESDVTSPEHKAAWERFEKDLVAWAHESAERAKQGLRPRNRPGVPGKMHGNRDATWMSNGRIAPMAPYAIRGAIWNQGYANMGEGIVYRNNLHSLVRGWRSVWNNPDLPVYFHQFYCPGGFNDGVSLDGRAEMRLGTWLAHMDIPHAAMASQIDITGGVHYFNKAVPGQRLALHALKNQYPSTELRAGGKAKDILADGPMYRGYTVQGNKLILELDHADGLCVGQSMTARGGYADPVEIKDGADGVTLFWLADGDLDWHRAKMEIAGDKIVLTAPNVKEPRGVAYGTNGVGTLPGIYNKAMLPLTPFIFYDHKLVVSPQWDLNHIRMPGVADRFEMFTWPKQYLPIAGAVVDPTTYGLQWENRRLPFLAPQYVDHCVIQAGVPTRLYGMVPPTSTVTVAFAGFEQSITLDEEQDEWEITVPAMKASAEPKELLVICTVNGEVAAERRLQNVVIGDVWYVAAPEFRVARGPGVPRYGSAPLEAWAESNPALRMFSSYASARSAATPQRFKLNASASPNSRFFQRWSPVVGLTKELAERIHARTGNPVGIVIMDPGASVPIKNWVGYAFLPKVEAWKGDAEILAPRYTRPEPAVYSELANVYIGRWREYWQKVATDKAFARSTDSGGMPGFPALSQGGGDTAATTMFNYSISAFSPGNFKAILCLTGKGFVAGDEGAAFGEQFAVMANSWKDAFARGNEVIDPYFVYTMPSAELAPNVTRPAGIQGKAAAFEIDEWLTIGSKKTAEGTEIEPSENLLKLIEFAVDKVY